MDTYINMLKKCRAEPGAVLFAVRLPGTVYCKDVLSVIYGKQDTYWCPFLLPFYPTAVIGGLMRLQPEKTVVLLGSSGGVESAFSDIKKLISKCRFSDCRHGSEKSAISCKRKRGQFTGRRKKNENIQRRTENGRRVGYD